MFFFKLTRISPAAALALARFVFGLFGSAGARLRLVGVVPGAAAAVVAGPATGDNTAFPVGITGIVGF